LLWRLAAAGRGPVPAAARLAPAIWYNPAVTLALLAARIVGVSFARFGRDSGSCPPEAKKSVAAFANAVQRIVKRFVELPPTRQTKPPNPP
jgi:hypothetical protein